LNALAIQMLMSFANFKFYSIWSYTFMNRIISYQCWLMQSLTADSCRAVVVLLWPLLQLHGLLLFQWCSSSWLFLLHWHVRACSYAGQLIVLCVCCCHMLRGLWSISFLVGMLMSWSALAFIAWMLLSPAGAIFFCCWCTSLGLHHAIIAAFCKYFCCLRFVLVALHLEHS